MAAASEKSSADNKAGKVRHAAGTRQQLTFLECKSCGAAVKQFSDGGGSGGTRGSGGRVASEDGHRDGHSQERDMRSCRNPEAQGRHDVWGPDPEQCCALGGTGAPHEAEGPEGLPKPRMVDRWGGAPSC